VSGAAAAGYSGTPLPRKLGVKPGSRALVIGRPEGAPELFEGGVRELGRAIAPLDAVVLFTTARADLARRLPALRSKLDEAGMIWVAWPKRASGVATDVTEDVVRDLALAGDLVDVKVCAIDATWSGLKLVVRREARR
jgi:hypothetical protein